MSKREIAPPESINWNLPTAKMMLEKMEEIAERVFERKMSERNRDGEG
jgi:hypothetical protein